MITGVRAIGMVEPNFISEMNKNAEKNLCLLLVSTASMLRLVELVHVKKRPDPANNRTFRSSGKCS